MRDQLEALEELSRIDLGFRQLDVELNEGNSKLAELRADVNRMRQLLDREKKQLVEVEQLRLQTLREIEDFGDRLTKSTLRHNNSKNTRERDATARELEVLRREKDERTGQTTELETVIGQLRDSISRHEKEILNLDEHLRGEETELEQLVKSIEERRTAHQTIRVSTLSRIRPDLLRKYHTIRERKGTAVAVISEGICRACNIAIPPQLFAKLHAASDVFQCPNCQRILVLRSLLTGNQ